MLTQGREFLSSWRWWLASIVFLVFIVVSLLKFSDLPEFESSLRGWVTLPTWAKAVAIPLAPAAELALALGWFFRIWPRRMAIGGIVLLILYSFALAIEGLWGYAKGCSCLGIIPQRLGLLNSNGANLVRNILFIAALAPTALCGHRAASGSRAPREETPPDGVPHAARGLTLVELLVALAIIGVLITLSLLGLQAVRRQSRSLAATALARQHVATLAAYCNDHRSNFPGFAIPRPTPTPVACEDLPAPAEILYFESYHMWNIALGGGYYGGHSRSELFHSPLAGPRSAVEEQMPLNDFLYPCVFLAAPSYWDLATRMRPTSQLRTTQDSEVRYSSRKSLIVHWAPSNRIVHQADEIVGFVDGHAGLGPLGQRMLDVGNDGLPMLTPLFGGHRSGGPPFLHTLNGVHGYDVK